MSELRTNPERPGVRQVDKAVPELRGFHLNSLRSQTRAGGRVGRPRHLLVFRADEQRLTLFRVLDDRMNLPEHIRAIDDVG